MRRIILISSGIALLITVALFLTGGIYAPNPPEKEINMMQDAITSARRNNAAEFAKIDFLECLNLYNLTMIEWRFQNEKWILKRNYSKLKGLANRTANSAINASKKAIQTNSSLKDYITKNITELGLRDSDFRVKFRNLPLDRNVFREHSSSHIKLLEAREMAKRGDLLGSYNSLVEAESGFYYIESEANELIKSYFKSYRRWEKWYTETINRTKSNGKYAIVIDKMAHKCLLIKGGKTIRKFDVELSEKWLGDKIHQGDNATPEGLYYITKMLDSKQTKFHKALLINYPNETDKKRYQEAIRSGAIPNSVHIGGLIEIHGDGGKGKDWTNGCVALTDKDMDQLFSIVKPGMTVTIVGSIVPLNELYSN